MRYQMKEISHERETNAVNPHLMAYIEMYHEVARRAGIENPPEINIVHNATEDEKTGEVMLSVDACYGMCPDAVMRIEISTGAIEAYKGNEQSLMAVMAHELSHHINNDVPRMIRSFRISFLLTFAVYLVFLTWIGMGQVIVDKGPFVFKPFVTEASEQKAHEERIKTAQEKVEWLKRQGEMVPEHLKAEASLGPYQSPKYSIFIILKWVWALAWNLFVGYFFVIFMAVNLYFILFPGAVLSYLIANAARLAICRPAEFRADEFAARVMGVKAAKGMFDPFLAEGEDIQTIFSRFLWNTHPAISIRIEHLEKLRLRGILHDDPPR